MVVGIKDTSKLLGILVIVFCAVLVCTMFLNYRMDLSAMEQEITFGQMRIFYEAQLSTATVVCAVSGGCLLLTSGVMLLFYIRYYIDTHKKELGILKALGYSGLKIAKHFWVFGSSVFLGAALGFLGAFGLIPSFYQVQNADQFLPEIPIHLHPSLFAFLVLLPTAAFAALAVGFAWQKLNMPVIRLLKDSLYHSAKSKKRKTVPVSSRPFLEDLKTNTRRDKKILVFFILFASFCFSSMTQMSAGMKDLGSVMMGAMMLLIGLVLACTTLFLAITTVINGNKKTIAMMRVFGYSQRECCQAILGGYRPVSYVGFALGTVYQYALLRIMVDLVFRDVEQIPVYRFDVPAMLLSLAAFIVTYELVMLLYSRRIGRISVKEIMLE
ncbi:MAG: FtsX-like permease family protein [Lachnospiraceae bacterium]|nr:FtsX-like permease family protein [Lachnospiraceae bacterium]